MKENFILTEYDKKLLEGYYLTVEEREYLGAMSVVERDGGYEQRFSFQEWRTGLYLTTNSWVGVIELDGVRIAIKPKFNRGFAALVDMICFVQQIPFYAPRETSSETGKSDLMELFVSLFLNELELLLQKGVVKEYVTEEDNLRQLRGRPDFLKNLRENYAMSTQIYCRYDELITDVLENQVLLLALELAYSFKLQSLTAKRLNRFKAELSLLCQPYVGESWPVFQYNRLNAHYSIAHRLAHYIVLHASINNIYRFKQNNFCSLLIDMNTLFEDYVRQLLQSYLPARFKVTGQARIKDAIMLNGDSYRYIIPDLLIYNQETKETTVIDTKYKNYGGKKLDNSDIYQLFFYSQYHHAKQNVPHCSTIVYPRYAGEKPIGKETVLQLLPGSIYTGELLVKDISIEDTLFLLKDNNKEDLQEVVLGLL